MATLYVLVVFGTLSLWSTAVCQDCDSFLCLKNFHDQLIDAQDNRTIACGVAVEYMSCVGEATEDCTGLNLQLQHEVAVRIVNISLCTKVSDHGNCHAPYLVITTLTALISVYIKMG